MSLTQDQLNQTLWAAADSSRVQVDASIYKDYALAVLFFKYLSDKSKAEVSKLRERFGDNAERIDEKMKLSRFYLPEGARFEDVYAQKKKIISAKFSIKPSAWLRTKMTASSMAFLER